MISSENLNSPDEALKPDLDPAAIFPYPLDDFQLEAIDALNQGHSVVVSSPTAQSRAAPRALGGQSPSDAVAVRRRCSLRHHPPSSQGPAS